MAAQITEVTDGAVLALVDGHHRILRPAENYPWWIDDHGLYHHPDNFEWDLP